MLTSKQRAALSALANSENTLFQIGKSGITPALIEQTDSALEARELINQAKGYTDAEAASYLAEAKKSICGLEAIEEKNVLDFARLYKAYADVTLEAGGLSIREAVTEVRRLITRKMADV